MKKSFWWVIFNTDGINIDSTYGGKPVGRKVVGPFDNKDQAKEHLFYWLIKEGEKHDQALKLSEFACTYKIGQ